MAIQPHGRGRFGGRIPTRRTTLLMGGFVIGWVTGVVTNDPRLFAELGT